MFLEVGEIVSCLNAFWFPRISSELFINKYSFVWICLGERERERERESEKTQIHRKKILKLNQEKNDWLTSLVTSKLSI